MATRQNGEPEPSRIIGSISKLAGALVGTAVVTGKRIIGSVTPPSEGPSDKPEEKTMQAPAKRKKKAVRKTEKVPKTKKKKKKVVKRKGTGSSGKSAASKKKTTQSPAKNKKGTTAKKKTTRRKTEKTAKSEGSSHSEDGLISEIGAGTNEPIGKHEPQLQPPDEIKLIIAEAEMADKKLSSANALPETSIVQKNSATGKQEPPVKIVEYGKRVKRPKRVVPIDSLA